MRHFPPMRRSTSQSVTSNWRGVFQRVTISGFVNASKTRLRGASRVRRMRITELPGSATTSVFWLLIGFLLFHFSEQLVESLVGLFPELAIDEDPFGDRLQAF